MPTKKFSKKLVRQVCDGIADGLTMEQVCKKYPDMPTSRTIRRWQQDRPEVHEQVTRAYDLFFQVKHSELEALSLERAPEGLDKLQLAAYNADKRARIDVLKFSLAKLASMLSNRFNVAQQIEVQGGGGAPVINVVTWAKPGEEVGVDVID